MKYITWKQFGVFSLLIIGLILAFSPIKRNNVSNDTLKTLAEKIVNKADHITAEQLGQLIIDKDPEIIIIDVRSNEDYKNYHINPSINMPLANLIDNNILNEIDPNKFLVLYSNGGTHAAQAWILLQLRGFKNSAVLLGGLNYWVDVYSNPEPPKGHYADHDMFRYQFLKSAGPKLLGTEQKIESSTNETKPPKVKPVYRRKKKKVADEGC